MNKTNKNKVCKIFLIKKMKFKILNQKYKKIQKKLIKFKKHANNHMILFFKNLNNIILKKMINLKNYLIQNFLNKIISLKNLKINQKI